jgi:hypothetical protein
LRTLGDDHLSGLAPHASGYAEMPGNGRTQRRLARRVTITERAALHGE